MFHESHTAETIKTELHNVLEEWDLDEERLTDLSTDNESNNFRALKDLGEYFYFCFESTVTEYWHYDDDYAFKSYVHLKK